MFGNKGIRAASRLSDCTAINSGGVIPALIINGKRTVVLVCVFNTGFWSVSYVGMKLKACRAHQCEHLTAD